MFARKQKAHERQSHAIDSALPPPSLQALKVPKRNNLETSASTKCSEAPSVRCEKEKVPLSRGGVQHIVQKFLHGAKFRSLETVAHLVVGIPLTFSALSLLVRTPHPELTRWSPLYDPESPLASTLAAQGQLVSWKVACISAITAAGLTYGLRRLTRAYNAIHNPKHQEALPADVSLKRRKMSLGNAGTMSSGFRSLLDRAPLVVLPLLVSFGPYLEEVIFRQAVATSAFGQTNPILAGLASSAVFAICHNLSFDKSRGLSGIPLTPRLPFFGALRFSTEHLPAQQFVMGLTLWGIFQWQGFQAAFLTHALANAYACSLMYLKAFRR